jgi:hypothetical protein
VLRSRRVLIGVAAAVVLLAAGGVLWWHLAARRTEPVGASASATGSAARTTASATSTAKPAHASSSPSPSRAATASPDRNDPGDGVATDPPVPAPTSPAQDGRTQATLVLTRWGQDAGTGALSAAAGVPGVVETGGTCTLTATIGNQTRSASGPATRSASAMACADGLSIPRSQLVAGTWMVQVSYSSQRYTGTSDTQVVTVQ